MTPQKNILITGATGGLGIELVSTFLNARYTVAATGRNAEIGKKLAQSGAQFVQADLTNRHALNDLCQGKEIVIHAAALSKHWGNPKDFCDINVKATEYLLDACLKENVKTFIFISSPSIYAAPYDQLNVDENDMPANTPLNDYAATKYTAEKTVLALNCSDFQTVSLRPRAIVGPNGQVLLPKIVEMLDKGILPFFRSGQALIELTDVRDVARAVLLSGEKIDVVAGQVFNISGGRPIKIKTLTQKIAHIRQQKPVFIPMPLWLGNVLAHKMEQKAINQNYTTEPRLTRYTLATMAYSQTFNMQKSKEMLGYTPHYDGLETILKEAGRTHHEKM